MVYQSAPYSVFNVGKVRVNSSYSDIGITVAAPTANFSIGETSIPLGKNNG